MFAVLVFYRAWFNCYPTSRTWSQTASAPAVPSVSLLMMPDDQDPRDDDDDYSSEVKKQTQLITCVDISQQQQQQQVMLESALNRAAVQSHGRTHGDDTSHFNDDPLTTYHQPLNAAS